MRFFSVSFIESRIFMANLSPNNEVTNRYLLGFYVGNTANHLTWQGQVLVCHWCSHCSHNLAHLNLNQKIITINNVLQVKEPDSTSNCENLDKYFKTWTGFYLLLTINITTYFWKMVQNIYIILISLLSLFSVLPLFDFHRHRHCQYGSYDLSDWFSVLANLKQCLSSLYSQVC